MSWSESQKRYYYSPKGVEARKRYWNSPKGKESRKRYMEKRKLRLKAVKTVQAVVENKPSTEKKKESDKIKKVPTIKS